MSVSELVISGYLLGDVCEFFIKKLWWQTTYLIVE